jgi:hypothetical protein
MRKFFVRVHLPSFKKAHSAKIEIGPSMACYCTVYQSLKYKESDLSGPPHATTILFADILCYGSLISTARKYGSHRKGRDSEMAIQFIY